jgi:competence protein ComEA
LEWLPGIGPTIARRIIEGRPFRSLDDLERVKGIGAKSLASIGPW